MDQVVFYSESGNDPETQNYLPFLTPWHSILMATTHAYWDIAKSKSEVYCFVLWNMLIKQNSFKDSIDNMSRVLLASIDERKDDAVPEIVLLRHFNFLLMYVVDVLIHRRGC